MKVVRATWTNIWARHMCGEANDGEIIGQLTKNSQAQNELSGDEKDKKIKKMKFSDSSEPMVHIHEIQCDFEISV